MLLRYFARTVTRFYHPLDCGEHKSQFSVIFHTTSIHILRQKHGLNLIKRSTFVYHCCNCKTMSLNGNAMKVCDIRPLNIPYSNLSQYGKNFLFHFEKSQWAIEEIIYNSLVNEDLNYVTRMQIWTEARATMYNDKLYAHRHFHINSVIREHSVSKRVYSGPI